jgi:hypothetical protein
MKVLVLLLLASSSLHLSHGANPTMRCLIGPKSVKVALKQSAAVFSGEVLEIKNGGNYMEVRIRVERSWKGVATEEVSVLTDSTTESPHYHVGDKYLVFAGIRDGKLFTGNCSRTKKLEYAQEDLQQLQEGKSRKEKRSSVSVAIELK